MEPRIQYVETKDGVSIAYCTLGEGMPFVYMPFPISHLQLDWEIPEFRSWYERLANNRQLVRYDGRGRGLSDRKVIEFSVDAGVRDLEAVLGRLSLERIALFASATSGPVGITYAARHPERVSHLILFNSAARTEDFTGGPQAEALLQLASANWEMFTETFAHVALGWSAGEPARRYAAIMRESVTQEFVQSFLAAPEFDVTELLTQVRSPTLVLHGRESPVPSADAARRLASSIPNARLTLLEGGSGSPALGDTEAVHSAINEFLGDGEEATAGAEAPAAGAVHTILFTDVEGSTALTQRLGDAKARELLREHERTVREALKAHGGSEVKTMGDGFMTSFSSASKALECAIAMQRAFAEHNESAEEPIKVRVGLNAGEPIAEDDDLFGTAVNLAARIAAQAEGGEILASEAVRQIVAGKKFPFSDRGETALRGFEDRVHIYQVSWREG